MSELPKGWIATTLGQVVNYAENEKFEPVDMEPNAWLLELEDIERDSSKLLDKKTVAERAPKSSKNKFSAGDVLYGKLRPYLNKVLRADEDGFCSSEIIPISAGLLNRDFIFHALRSPVFIEYVQSASHGMGMPRLGTQQAKAAPFLLPPLAEQTRIAQKLDELLAQVGTLKARLDAIPALLKRFRQSTLAAAVSGRLTNTSESLTLPASWKMVPLSAALQDLRYGTAQKCDYNGGAVGVLRIPNIGDREITLNDLKSSDFSETEINKLSLQEGDILIIRSNGSVDLVGKSAVVGNKEAGLLFAGYLIRLRLDRDQALPAYVNFWLKSPTVRQVIEQTARSTSGVNNINSEEIKSLEFTMPPLDEQTEIVRRIEQLFAFTDQLEAKIKTAQARVNQLTQSILAKAFRGELVPQDPNDEPASELLARIKAQRAAAPKAKRGRKASA